MWVNDALEIKDPASLNEAVKKAIARGMSPQEKLAQRVSFVFASMSANSGVTKEQIRKALSEEEPAGGR
jgi:SpoU rRNA methylase family enzyme